MKINNIILVASGFMCNFYILYFLSFLISVSNTSYLWLHIIYFIGHILCFRYAVRSEMKLKKTNI